VLRLGADRADLEGAVRTPGRALLAAAACALMVLAGAPVANATPGPSDAPEWWFDRWGVPALWAAGADGRGMTIAEIDSGVNASLPQLAAKVLPGTDFGSLGGDGQVDREIDPFGHGTAMASIMVAAPGIFGIEGLAPAAKVLPVAIPLIGTQDASTDDHLAEAIRWSADHGANIINMSLGADRDQADDSVACPADEQAAIYYALSKGDVLVAAAGNNGPSGDDLEEPSICIGVVTVGAIDSSGAVASFSSRTPKLTLTAPGVNIPSLGRIAGQAYDGKGTSQASAITSAALALVWSKYPTLTNRQLVARVLATLDNRQASADPAAGYGQLNPATAINTDVPADAPNPVYDVSDPFVKQLTPVAAPKVPAPAAVAPAPAGTFTAAAPGSDVTGEVRVAGGIGLAGLLGLLLLLVFGLRGRRHRAEEHRRNALPVWAAAGVGAGWHDVFEPPQWAAPSQAPQWAAPPGEVSVVYPPPSLTRTEPPTPDWLPPATHPATTGSPAGPPDPSPADERSESAESD
jgi:subtilisin family serine protease